VLINCSEGSIKIDCINANAKGHWLQKHAYQAARPGAACHRKPPLFFIAIEHDHAASWGHAGCPAIKKQHCFSPQASPSFHHVAALNNLVQATGASVPPSPAFTNHSPPVDKIRLFRSLFRGREDVYPRRFESRKTGRSGYAPA
jgi:hypothetical protein